PAAHRRPSARCPADLIRTDRGRPDGWSAPRGHSLPEDRRVILRRAWHRIHPPLRMPTMADALPVADVPALGPDGHLHHLILPGYGLIEAPFEQTVERFGNEQRANARRMEVLATT